MIQNNNYNKVAVLVKPGAIDVMDCECFGLTPENDFVRIKIEYCAICGTDVSFFNGERDAKYPFTLGHEYCGSIHSIGKNVSEWSVGDYVTVDPNFRCNDCKMCLDGRSNLCDKSDLNLFSNRGFAKFVELHKGYLYGVSDLRNSYRASLVEPLSCALHAISLAAVKKSDDILILGAGGIGTMIAFALSATHDKKKITICDIVKEKVFIIENKLGIKAIKLCKSERSENINKFSIVFEATGEPSGLNEACRRLSKGGKIVILSRYDRIKDLTLLHHYLMRNEAALIFSHLNGNGKSMDSAYKMIRKFWSDDLDGFCVIEKFDQIQRVFEGYKFTSNNKTIIKIN